MKKKQLKEFNITIKKAAKIIVENGGNTENAANAIRNMSRRERRLLAKAQDKKK